MYSLGRDTAVRSRPMWMALLALFAVVGLLAGVHHLLFPRNSAANGLGRWTYPTVPHAHPDGRRWRIAYYEGGPWVDYPRHLRSLIHGLMKLGWIEQTDLPATASQDDSWPVWQALCDEGHSDVLEFAPEAYISAQWDEEQRPACRTKMISLLQSHQFDLVIAMGTWAGQDLANDEHDVPVVVCSTSDPVAAGIIASPDDSGRDHVHAVCDPDRYVRELSAYHNIVGFHTLGVVYEDTEMGRVYASMREVDQVAAARGFRVLCRHVREEGVPEADYVAQTREAFAELAPQVDAVWISAQQGQSSKFMPDLLQPLLDHHVATWSQEGTAAVRRGVLLSVCEAEPLAVGDVYAHTIAAILNGVRPRRIRQLFHDPLALSINTETARRIGIQIPEILLHSSDNIYDTIENPDESEESVQ